MSVTLYRHAESVSNLDPSLIGWFQPDTPLSPMWEKQAISLWNRLKRDIHQGIIQKPDWVFTSAAVRTKRTAEIVQDILNVDFHIIEDCRLSELSQWDWEGKPRIVIHTPEMCAFINSTNGTHRPPNGESQEEVSDRMESWLGSLNSVHNNWAFSHALAIQCLIARKLWMPQWSAWLHTSSNTGITEINKKAESWSLLRFNDHSHIHSVN